MGAGPGNTGDDRRKNPIILFSLGDYRPTDAGVPDGLVRAARTRIGGRLKRPEKSVPRRTHSSTFFLSCQQTLARAHIHTGGGGQISRPGVGQFFIVIYSLNLTRSFREPSAPRHIQVLNSYEIELFFCLCTLPGSEPPETAQIQRRRWLESLE